MRYLKLYEDLETEYSLKDYLKDKIYTTDWYRLDLDNININSLKGIEMFKNLDYLNCGCNKLTSLKGIENCTKLKFLNVKNNNITSLKGIENCTELKDIDCSENQIKYLDELVALPKLKKLWCFNHTLEIQNIEIMEKFTIWNLYNMSLFKKFNSYKYQKKILTDHPEKIIDLKYLENEVKKYKGKVYKFDWFVIHPRIKEEFPALTRSSEWGFFDLERSSV